MVVRAALAVGGPGLAVGRARLLLERLRALLELAGRERGRAPARRGIAEHALARLERVERLLEPPPVAGGGEAARRLRARRGERGRVRVRRRAAGPAAPAASRRASAASSGRRARSRAARRRRPRRRRSPAAPARRRPRLERALVGVAREPLGGALVEHLEARVEPGGERPRAQDARAEAVDRADPARVDLARVLLLAERQEAPADALPQLAGGLLGEREREDRADRHAVAQHRLDAALGHHRRLARAGVGGEQRGARAVVDRRALLGGEGDGHAPALIRPPGRSSGTRSPSASTSRGTRATCARPQRVARSASARSRTSPSAASSSGSVDDVRRHVAPGHVVAHQAARARVARPQRLVEPADRLEARAARAPRACRARPGARRPPPSRRPAARSRPCSRARSPRRPGRRRRGRRAP